MLCNGEVNCQIEWKQRFDGSKPKDSWYTNNQLKINYPLLLIEYYESKLRLIRTKQ